MIELIRAYPLSCVSLAVVCCALSWQLGWYFGAKHGIALTDASFRKGLGL